MFACFLDWVAVWLTLLLLPFSLPIPSREDIHKTGDQNSNMADNGMLTDAQIMEDPSGKFEHEKEVKRIEEARAVDGLFSMNVSDSLFEHLFPYNRGSRAWTTRKVVVGGESEHHLLEFPFVSDFLPFLLRLLNILPPWNCVWDCVNSPSFAQLHLFSSFRFSTSTRIYSPSCCLIPRKLEHLQTDCHKKRLYFYNASIRNLILQKRKRKREAWPTMGKILLLGRYSFIFRVCCCIGRLCNLD